MIRQYGRRLFRDGTMIRSFLAIKVYLTRESGDDTDPAYDRLTEMSALAIRWERGAGNNALQFVEAIDFGVNPIHAHSVGAFRRSRRADR